MFHFLIFHMKKSHGFFFEEASIVCLKSQHPKFYHGSVLVYKNTIIGRGSNGGNGLNKRRHAEVASMKNKHLKKHTKCRSKLLVFVVRLNVSGEYRNSRPCERCQDFMRKNGVDEVFYSMGNGRFESMKL